MYILLFALAGYLLFALSADSFTLRQRSRRDRRRRRYVQGLWLWASCVIAPLLVGLRTLGLIELPGALPDLPMAFVIAGTLCLMVWLTRLVFDLRSALRVPGSTPVVVPVAKEGDPQLAAQRAKRAVADPGPVAIRLSADTREQREMADQLARLDRAVEHLELSGDDETARLQPALPVRSVSTDLMNPLTDGTQLSVLRTQIANLGKLVIAQKAALDGERAAHKRTRATAQRVFGELKESRRNAVRFARRERTDRLRVEQRALKAERALVNALSIKSKG